jgi:hypothetical protein
MHTYAGRDSATSTNIITFGLVFRFSVFFASSFAWSTPDASFTDSHKAWTTMTFAVASRMVPPSCAAPGRPEIRTASCLTNTPIPKHGTLSGVYHFSIATGRCMLVT